MQNMSLWLRWSWRDLRARWLQVAAIALIIALGTGVFAGMGGQKKWRIDSMNASYDRLNMYDLHMEMADGSYVDHNELLAALANIEGVDTLEARLIVPTLVDASKEDEEILVTGRIVGVDVSEGGPHVNSLFVKKGRGLTEADVGQNVVGVEYNFVKYYDLEPGDPIRISGDITLDFVGSVMSPEYFVVVPEGGFIMGENSLAVLFVPLATAQALAGREGLVNDVALTLVDGADLAAVQTEIESRMAAAFPDTGVTFVEKADDPGRRMMYSDAREDQVTWDTIALLFIAGAALGAFNLAGRIVESQRRQIGVGMALGVPRFWIAFRPLLVGVQIAVLGTIFGLGVGLLLSEWFISLLKSLLPLPYWKTSFYVPGYVRAMLIGIVLPFLATLIPVWRAVRVQPVDAIRSGYLVAKGGGLSWMMKLLPVPGRSFMQMPFKNLLRAPWRTLMTLLGISMAIVLMTAFIGFLDTFVATMDRAEDAYLYQAPDRLIVSLDFFYPVENGEISAIRDLKKDGAPLFQTVEPALILNGTLLGEDEDIDVMLELHAMESAIWRPTLLRGSLKPSTHRPGIILSEKAASDIGVGVGDTVTFEHPRREGPLAFRLVKEEFEVTGIHNNPLRALAYMDLSQAGLMGLSDTTNYLVVKPSDGGSANAVKLALLSQPGVASVYAVSEFTDAFEEVLDFFVQFLRVVQIIVLFMAFLIAFNSASINVDERIREIATMFAFGLPIRTVTRMQVVESMITGILGTVLGIILGWFALNAMLVARVEEQLADFGFIVTISPTTLIISALLGVLVVSITPLLSIRRMARMDIPSTLRVME